MKLHLLLLVSLFRLSNGYMVELRGPLNKEKCTGEEYAAFKDCATQGAKSDPDLPAVIEVDEQAYVNQGGERRLKSWCGGCSSGAPRGSFCFTFCGRFMRRLEEVTDTPNSRRLQEDSVAVCQDNSYIGEGEAIQIAEAIMECLGDVSTTHPCLGSTNTMILIVHTTLSAAEDLLKPAGCLRGRQ
jgi:hypothetical protein